ncbi:hypothetical protein H105_07715 [Trichophyton soudanense CBS 452.61]|uniref:Uncharacterized protein n=1 Tax=Trichophyton soudanense CBS 452.61 TaxID=1215331 RepID=A0A022XHT4_TRISD|nr:hypothetical protein H105_07715 [Trichophyton soudanense CBS 452.61]
MVGDTRHPKYDDSSSASNIWVMEEIIHSITSHNSPGRPEKGGGGGKFKLEYHVGGDKHRGYQNQTQGTYERCNMDSGWLQGWQGVEGLMKKQIKRAVALMPRTLSRKEV